MYSVMITKIKIMNTSATSKLSTSVFISSISSLKTVTIVINFVPPCLQEGLSITDSQDLFSFICFAFVLWFSHLYYKVKLK